MGAEYSSNWKRCKFAISLLKRRVENRFDVFKQKQVFVELLGEIEIAPQSAWNHFSKTIESDNSLTVINRANNMLGIIKHFSHSFLDPYPTKTLYIAYERSTLKYCSIVWLPFSVRHEERIESVQMQFLLFTLRRLGWTNFPPGQEYH